MRQQDPPFCVQIELTEGCNLRCPFCGINGIRTNERKFKYMTTLVATEIATDLEALGWNCRFEFAMHGEPTMNPAILDILDIFRSAMPKNYMLMETNGGGIVQRGGVTFVSDLFRYLDTVAIDEYRGIAFAEKIWKDCEGKLPDVTMFRYPQEKDGNPHHRSKKKRLVRVAPIDTATSGTHATLNNHAGSGAAPDDTAEGHRCAKPFRELSIRWDGSVALCCNDWRGVYKCGNVMDQSIESIWNGEEMHAARCKLYHGQRDFGVCKGCNAKSYRPGLLPDHLGKSTLPEPDQYDLAIIARATGGTPYTKPVPRPWEEKK